MVVMRPAAEPAACVSQAPFRASLLRRVVSRGREASLWESSPQPGGAEHTTGAHTRLKKPNHHRLSRSDLSTAQTSTLTVI